MKDGPAASTAELARVVTQRTESLLAHDMSHHHEEIAERVSERRILVVGGAGSIGSATIAALLPYAPARLDIVDVDENGLTELVRDLRSQDLLPRSTRLRTTPLDAGSPTMRRMIDAGEPHDLVLNFAAVKHVRSEKDIYSLLHMLDVNVRLPRRLLDWVAGDVERYFAVSTDKAANPVNLMGASKRAMEHVILDEDLGPAVSTARFANVAFSQGSLLDGWLRRLEKRQAWAVPEGVRRFFVTPEESGQLCLLAAAIGPPGRVLVPDLDPGENLRLLTDVAADVLAAMGLRPLWCTTEDEARAAAGSRSPGEWPVLVTTPDTTGEKEFEEFVADSEEAVDCGFRALLAVQPSAADPEVIRAVGREIDAWLEEPSLPVDLPEAVEVLRRLVPELVHRASDHGLDARM